MNLFKQGDNLLGVRTHGIPCVKFLVRSIKNFGANINNFSLLEGNGCMREVLGVSATIYDKCISDTFTIAGREVVFGVTKGDRRRMIVPINN